MTLALLIALAGSLVAMSVIVKLSRCSLKILSSVVCTLCIGPAMLWGRAQ